MPEPVTFYVQEGKGKALRIAEAFSANVKTTLSDGKSGLLPGLAVFYGVDDETLKLYLEARNEGRAYYIDNGYFSPGSNGYYRVTRDNLQHNGVGYAPPDRFMVHQIDIKPWKADEDRGGYILVTLQTEPFYDKFCTWGSRDVWQAHVLDALNTHSPNRPIVFRDKPSKAIKQPDLMEQISNAWALVTFTSNTAVEAALEGIPVFCTHPCAASDMGTSDLSRIENPAMPQDTIRKGICQILAYNQWSLDEIRAGKCWDDLMKKRRDETYGP